MAIVKSRSSKQNISLKGGSVLTAVRVLDVILERTTTSSGSDFWYSVLKLKG